jgi:hypothetical protein
MFALKVIDCVLKNLILISITLLLIKKAFAKFHPIQEKHREK